jgi:uncharacterized repeat protein (TIGR03803 family)
MINPWSSCHLPGENDETAAAKVVRRGKEQELAALRFGQRSGSRQASSVRPRLEELETRLTPSYSFSTLATFPGVVGGPPVPYGLDRDTSGNLYGTTGGGIYGKGTVLELAQGSNMITTLAAFNGTDGAGPAGLIMDSSGNLYGTTTGGGASQDGTVFELAKGSGTITTLTSFDGNNGSDPHAGLVMDSSGNLYGTTRGGGASNDGAVFEMPSGSGTITTLTTFNGTNGADPFAGLLMDSSGNLYSTTDSGGPANDGTVFELQKQPTIDQWTGANFAVDRNWSDGANWSPGAPPTTGQTALFTSNASVKHFTATVDAGFTNTIAGLNIDSTWGATIIVSSPLTVPATLDISSASFTTLGSAAKVQLNGPNTTFTNRRGLTTIDAGGSLTLAGNQSFTTAGALTRRLGTFRVCDTRSSLLLCRVAKQRRHLPFCRQYPTGTCVAGNGGVRSSRDNEASSSGMARKDASPARDSEHQRGRAPGWCGMVNSGEALVNAVMSNKRKMLSRLGQNGTWSGPGAILSPGADGAPPAKRRDLTRTAATTERGKPVVSPRDPLGCGGTANRKASPWGCG